MPAGAPLGRPSGPYRREDVNVCHQSVFLAINQSLYGRNWNNGQAHGPSQFHSSITGRLAEDCAPRIPAQRKVFQAVHRDVEHQGRGRARGVCVQSLRGMQTAASVRASLGPLYTVTMHTVRKHTWDATRIQLLWGSFEQGAVHNGMPLAASGRAAKRKPWNTGTFLDLCSVYIILCTTGPAVLGSAFTVADTRQGPS